MKCKTNYKSEDGKCVKKKGLFSNGKKSTIWLIMVAVGLIILFGVGFILFTGGKDIELSEYKSRILSWGSPTTYPYWELLSNPMADYVSIGDRYGSSISVIEISNCIKQLNEMVDDDYITYKENICGVDVYWGKQREPSTVTAESEFLCSSDNRFIVSIRPKESPIKDKYFEEFVC